MLPHPLDHCSTRLDEPQPGLDLRLTRELVHHPKNGSLPAADALQEKRYALLRLDLERMLERLGSMRPSDDLRLRPADIRLGDGEVCPLRCPSRALFVRLKPGSPALHDRYEVMLRGRRDSNTELPAFSKPRATDGEGTADMSDLLALNFLGGARQRQGRGKRELSPDVGEVMFCILKPWNVDSNLHVRTKENGRIPLVGNPAFAGVCSRDFNQRNSKLHLRRGDQEGVKMGQFLLCRSIRCSSIFSQVYIDLLASTSRWATAGANAFVHDEHLRARPTRC